MTAKYIIVSEKSTGTITIGVRLRPFDIPVRNQFPVIIIKIKMIFKSRVGILFFNIHHAIIRVGVRGQTIKSNLIRKLIFQIYPYHYIRLVGIPRCFPHLPQDIKTIGRHNWYIGTHPVTQRSQKEISHISTIAAILVIRFFVRISKIGILKRIHVHGGPSGFLFSQINPEIQVYPFRRFRVHLGINTIPLVIGLLYQTVILIIS